MTSGSLDWSGFQDVSVLYESPCVHARAVWENRLVSVLVAEDADAKEALRSSDAAFERLEEAGARVVSVLKSYEDAEGRLWCIRAREQGDTTLEAVHLAPRKGKRGYAPFTSDQAKVFVQHAIQISQLATRMINAGLSARGIDLSFVVIRQTSDFPSSGEPIFSCLPSDAKDAVDGVQAGGRLLAQLMTGRRTATTADLAYSLSEAQDFADLCDVDLDIDLPDIVSRAMDRSPAIRYVSTLSLAIDLVALRNPDRDVEWAPGRIDQLSRFKIDSSRIWGREPIIEQIRAIVRQPRESVPGNGFRQICLVGEPGVGKSAIFAEAVSRLQGEAAAYLHKYEQNVANPELDLPIKAFNYLFRYLLTRMPQSKDESCRRMRETLDQSVLDVIRSYLEPDVQEAFFEAPAAISIPPDKVGEIIRTGIFGIANVLLDLIRPFVIILDDVQWMPEGDRALINWGSMYSDCNLIGAVALRADAELTPGAKTIADEMDALVAKIPIGKLDQQAILQWVNSVLFGDVKTPDKQDRRTIARVAEHLLLKADGNALLTSQVLRQLYASGALSFNWPLERWVVDQQSLLSVQSFDLLGDRLGSLDPALLAFLQTFSALLVLGNVTRNELFDALDGDEARKAALLSRSIDLGFVAQTAALSQEVGPALRFVHDLVTQAIGESECDWPRLRLRIALRLLCSASDVRRPRLITLVAAQAVEQSAEIPASDALTLAQIAFRAAQDADAAGAANVALSCSEAACKFGENIDLWNSHYELAADLGDLHCSLLHQLRRFDTAARYARRFFAQSKGLRDQLRAGKWLIRSLAAFNTLDAFRTAQTHLKTLVDLDLRPLTTQELGLSRGHFPSVSDMQTWQQEDDPAARELSSYLLEVMWVTTAIGFDHVRGAYTTALAYCVHHERLDRETMRVLLSCASSQLTLHPAPDRLAIDQCESWARSQASKTEDAELRLFCDLMWMNGSHTGDLSFDATKDKLFEATNNALTLCDYRTADFTIRNTILDALFGSKPLSWIVELRPLLHQIITWHPLKIAGCSVFSQFAANLRSELITPDSSSSSSKGSLSDGVDDPLRRLCDVKGPLHPVTVQQETAGPSEWIHRFLQILMGLVLNYHEPAWEAVEALAPARDTFYPTVLRTLFPFVEGLVLVEQLRRRHNHSLKARIEADINRLQAVSSCCDGDYRGMLALLRADYAHATPSAAVKPLFEDALAHCVAKGQHLLIGLCCERYAAYAMRAGDESLAEQQQRKAKQAWAEWGATVKLDPASAPITPLSLSPVTSRNV